MRLENLAVVVRPRASWESLDLGLLLVRRWFKPIFGPWLLVLVPFYTLLMLASGDVYWAPPLILWWTKPLWDRIPLFVLSRAMFGDTPALSHTLRNVPGLLKGELFATLTYARFSPFRSLNLPILLLEGQGREQRAKRRKFIRRDISDLILAKTFLFLAFEACVLFASCWVMIFLLVPESFQSKLGDSFFPNWELFLSNWFYLAVVAFLEPFFVGAGFTLYINRRTIQEGWDIELSFRKMKERLEGAASQATKLAIVFLLAFGLVMESRLYAGPAGRSQEFVDSATNVDIVAQEDDAVGAMLEVLAIGEEQALTPEQIAQNEAIAARQEEVKQAIQKVLAHPDFETTKEEVRWVWRFDGEDQQEAPQSSDSALLELLAVFAKLAIWVLGFALLCLVVYWVLRLTQPDKPIQKKDPDSSRESSSFVQVLDLESLPEDVLGAARRAFDKGNVREAFSLLYRGSLRLLNEEGHVTIEEFDTEEACLRRLTQSLQAPALAYMTQLTRTWQNVAYAHRAPSGEVFDQLCKQWLTHLQGGDS